jgi:hypothetical protein
MIYLPTVPANEIIEYKTNIPASAISTPANTFSYLIAGLPINYVVCGTNMRLLTAFAASGLSSLTASLAAFVPNTILSNLNYYGLSMELTQFVTPIAFSQSGPPENNLNDGLTDSFAPVTGLYFNGAHDLAVYFTSTGALLNTLSAGALEVTIHIRPC